MLYLDASAMFKRYVSELGSAQVETTMMNDGVWVTANHSYVEISIALGRRLDGLALTAGTDRFERDWDAVTVVSLDDTLCRRAADLGVQHRVRSLDALHLAAAERVGGKELTFLTFDTRLGDAARSMGFPVAVI
jgi:predicted nucleic acid-binding protein